MRHERGTARSDLQFQSPRADDRNTCKSLNTYVYTDDANILLELSAELFKLSNKLKPSTTTTEEPQARVVQRRPRRPRVHVQSNHRLFLPVTRLDVHVRRLGG